MFGFTARWLGTEGIKRIKGSPLPEETIDVSAAITAIPTPATTDVDYSTNPLKGLYVGGAGLVYVRRVDDAVGVFVKYDCDKGTYIYGLIAGIGVVTGRATTATLLVGER